MDEQFSVNEVVPIELSSIQPNSHVGIASMPRSHGNHPVSQARLKVP
jgi:hypothetical protein